MGLGSTPASAGEAASANPCADAALAQAQENRIDTSAGIDFACIGDVVSVQGETVDGVEVATEESSAGWYELWPEDCTPTTELNRFIINDLQSAMEWCMYWGQRNDPVNGDWTVTTVANFNLNLGHGTHNYSSGFYSDDYQTSGYTTITGFTHLKRERGGFPPATVDSTSWTSNHFDRFFGFLAQPATNGVYSVHWDTMNITNTAKAFEMEIAQPQLATHRFLCGDNWDFGFECRWPDGEEAVL